MSENTDILGQLETQIIKASEGDKAALAEFSDTIKSVPALPADVAEFVSENLELIITSPQDVTVRDELRDLALSLAARGADCMLLRDCLAALARGCYSDYSDPAGMIRAIGILDQATPILEVYQRYEMFAELKEGAHVWHDSYGLGKIVEIDPFSGLVYITFSSKQNFGLDQVLSNLNIAKEDSLVARLRDKKESFNKSVSPREFDAEVAHSFVPTLRSPRMVVEALLVPAFLGHGGFISWRDSGETAPRNKPQQAAPKVVLADKSVLPKLPDPGDVICWENARSLQELKVELAKQDKIDLHEGHVEHFLKLYKFAAARPKFASDFAKTLIMLLDQSKGRDLVDDLVSRLPEESQVWANLETFVTVTNKLKAKQLEAWFHISWTARGKEWFMGALTKLPLRAWSYGEDTVKNHGAELSELQEFALSKFQSRDCGADLVVWLWKQQTEASMAIFANPRLAFEVLGIQVVGDFIRGRKLLHELIMNDEKFQAAMMDNGSLAGIENLVKTVRSVKALERGEQQSLLVKIVRQYPEARPFVEEKKGSPTRKKTAKMSSYRSVQALQSELDEIISKLIPENATAIAEARSYGDLRENFEFKAAKDNQRKLAARRIELETWLNEVVATDFSDVDIDDVVVPGCSVEIDVGGSRQIHHLLGIWDSDPERMILSYDAPLGRILMGKNVGDEITLPLGQDATIVALHELPDEIREWLKPLDD